MKKIDPHQKITYSDELIEVTEERVFWWNVKVKTTTNVKNQKIIVCLCTPDDTTKHACNLKRV